MLVAGRSIVAEFVLFVFASESEQVRVDELLILSFSIHYREGARGLLTGFGPTAAGYLVQGGAKVRLFRIFVNSLNGTLTDHYPSFINRFSSQVMNSGRRNQQNSQEDQKQQLSTEPQSTFQELQSQNSLQMYY